MEKEVFTQFVTKYILPLFPGVSIETTQDIDWQNTTLVVSGPQTTKLYLQQKPNASFRILIQRSQPFEPNEKDLLSFIMTEISEWNVIPDSYKTDFEKKSLTSAISRYLNPTNYLAIQNTLEILEELSSRSYEGQRISLGIGFEENSTESGDTKIEDVLKLDFGLVLSNGINTIIKSSYSGRILGYEELTNTLANPDTPVTFAGISNWTNESKVSIALNRNGELLLFRNKKLLFTKRRGSWQYYPHESLRKQIAARTQRSWTPELRSAVYESALDCSFARTGGLIALIKRQQGDDVTRYLKSEDLIAGGSTTKAKLLETLSLPIFNNLSRKLRQELLAIDGSMIVSYNGKILNSGAMVLEISPSEDGGARSAAARTLGKCGVAMKISMDGKITCYTKTELEVEKFLEFG